MAESIAIHFKRARWDELRPVLDSVASPVEPDRWHFPRQGEPCVWIDPCDDLLNEYEDQDLDRLFKFLDDFPSSTLCIQLRASQGNKACDCAMELVLLLLKQFEGIADDLLLACWTMDEINEGVTKDTGRFLDCYRIA
jgi:hypothetical protein